MPRIRTIKPDFMRHEGLQDLEVEHPGSYIMLTYVGLWMMCDKNGIFQYRPRQLKLDILPFIPFDMQSTLTILENNGYLKKYTVDGKDFGIIPTFRSHQRLSGKEASEEGEKYPLPIETICEAPETYPETKDEASEDDTDNTCEIIGNSQGSNGEADGKNVEACGKNCERQNVQEMEMEMIKNSSSEADAVRLADFLFQNIRTNSPKLKTPNMRAWTRDIDLMLRIDNRTAEEIREMITWCQQDTFWKSNILSPRSLRDKFDQLKLKKDATTTTDRGSRFKVYRAGDTTAFEDPVYDDDD